jgi:hypothetical protein
VSTGYTAIIRVGDGTNTAGTYGQFAYTATTTISAAFPNVSISPSTGPNASPASVSIPAETLDGTASGVWPAAPSAETSNPFSVTSTGALLFSKNGNTADQGPTSFVLNDTIDLTWDPAVVDATANGGTVSGDLVGAPYTNSYSMTIDRTPGSFTLTALSGEAVSSQVNSETVNIAGINVPTFLTYTSGSPNSLTNPFVSINNGPQVAIPSSGNTLKVSPGDSVEFFADTGATAPATYTITFNMGSLSVPWSVATAVTPGVVQPSITNPSNNATKINPTSVFPNGVTLTGSVYATTGGAGAHTSSSWQLYEAIPYQPETADITQVNKITIPSPLTGWQTGTLLTNGISNFGVALAYGNGTWVALTASNTAGASSTAALTSRDAKTWSLSFPPFPFTSSSGAPGGRALAFGAGKFVAGSAAGNISYSTDGITWTQITVTSLGAVRWIAYGGGKFVAMAGASGNTPWTSPDGINWTVGTTLPAAGFQNGGYYANSLWVSVGNSGTLFTSSDGSTWVQKTSGVGANTLNSVTYGNGVWVAVGDNAGYTTSPDGTTWTAGTFTGPSASNIFLSVTFGDGLFLAANFTTVGYMASTDGSTWTQGTPAGVTRAGAALWAAGRFMWLTSASSRNVATTLASYYTLTFSSNTAFADFSVNDYVVENGGGGDGQGVILAIRPGVNEIDIASDGNWTVGSTMVGASSDSLITPGVPTTNPPSATYYSAVVNVANDTSNLTSYFVPVSSLKLGTKYYARVSYTSSDPVTSAFSAWSAFTTAASWFPASTPGYWRELPSDVTSVSYVPNLGGAGNTPTSVSWLTDLLATSDIGLVGIYGTSNDGYLAFVGDAGGNVVPAIGGSSAVYGAHTTNGVILATVSAAGRVRIWQNQTPTFELPPTSGVAPRVLAPPCTNNTLSTNVLYCSMTNGKLYLYQPTAGTFVGAAVNPGWTEISYTLPGGEQITQIAQVTTTSAYVLSTAGNLYLIGAAYPAGSPTAGGTWSAPVQITGISNVQTISTWGANESSSQFSAVTTTGDLWFAGQRNLNVASAYNLAQVSSGCLSVILPASIRANTTTYYVIKTDGYYYSRTTSFASADPNQTWTAVSYGTNPKNPIYQVGAWSYLSTNGANRYFLIP